VDSRHANTAAQGAVNELKQSVDTRSGFQLSVVNHWADILSGMGRKDTAIQRIKSEMRNHYETNHPLNGAPVNSRPPASNIMLATAGRAYHFKPSFSNQGYLVKNNTKINLERGQETKQFKGFTLRFSHLKKLSSSFEIRVDLLHP